MTRPFRLDEARAETPGADRVIHLNNAGAGLMPLPVLDAYRRHLDLEVELGGYEAEEIAAALVQDGYLAAAELLGCSSDDVAFTDSASSAWNRGFGSIPLAPGDRVLASPVEYGSNYVSLLHAAGRSGAEVALMPVDEYGQVDVGQLESMLTERDRVMVVTHVPSNGGLVNPVAEIGKLARTYDLLYVVDACQSVGQIPLDVAEVGCDLLAGSGRKYLRGPRGTGFLYVRPQSLGRLEPSTVGLDGVCWVDGGGYAYRDGARRFEMWESDVAARIAFGAAIRYALDWSVETTYARIQELADYLRQGLDTVPGVVVRDRGVERCGLVTFTVDQPMRELRDKLRHRGVNIWTCLVNSACEDMEVRGFHQLLRASVHYYNTTDELDLLCRELCELLSPAGVAVGQRRAGGQG